MDPESSDTQRELPTAHHRRPAAQRRARYTLEDITSAERELADVDTELRALWDFTNASPDPYSELSFPSPPLQTQGNAEESRRIKRRKLDSDRLSTGFNGFRYGKYGQIEPGQLTMEIVSCDGGIFADDGQKHAAENILKPDASVYCTSGPTCNIVLRHQGATAFTLKKLVIKAPKANYTAPVSEGMVFVSMSSDQLLTRTAQYQIQYSAPRRRAESETQQLPPVISIRHNPDGDTMTRAQVRARRLYNIGLDDQNNDLRVAQIPSEFDISPAQCRVTIEYGHDETDDIDGLREDVRAPNRIGSLPFESETSDDEGNLEDYHQDGSTVDIYSYAQQPQTPIHSSGYAEAREAAQIATQEAVRAVGGEMLTPDARFYIEQDKSTCTMTFDPPVSGRFILLKMWSPHRDSTANIDIQAVTATGFAGPRFFPSVELR
ncbi:hypothetical protein SLS62_009740 [Diatrype stigma]|uniref:Uncharacterized protein n=1 Tax=Diatrype stigma TaxID=117547 RepID=A0AAN9UFB7_9PEZI